MENYSGLHYESYTNCFERTEHIESSLLYGNPEIIEKPWITVVIPTYKRVDLLKQALDSVLRQWHVNFYWDIVIVDNEAYDGKPNETEKYIRHLDNKRILYYRNSETMRPGDNFNRGILLARGEWISILHDDDLLVTNTLQSLGKLILFYQDKPGKPLGAISTQYIQFEYDPEKEIAKIDIPGTDSYLISLPTNYRLYKLTHNTVLFTGHIGGFAPTTGTIYNRAAVMKTGGFNEDMGIYADLILLYQMENNYSVFSTLTPLGFYRWGSNISSKRDTSFKLVRECYNFREYAYSKSFLTRIFGRLFRNCHYKRFALSIINDQKNSSKKKLKLNDFDCIYSHRPMKLTYFIYSKFVVRAHSLFKKTQSKRLARGSKEFEEKYFN